MSPVKNVELIPCSRKIADLTQADGNKYFITMDEMELPANTVMLLLNVDRTAGTGVLRLYPHELLVHQDMVNGNNAPPFVFFADNGRIQYSLSVANDTFELHCRGYVIQIVRG